MVLTVNSTLAFKITYGLVKAFRRSSRIIPHALRIGYLHPVPVTEEKTRRQSVFVGAVFLAEVSYLETSSMNGTAKKLAQPLAYRVWDPDHHSFFHTDVFPDTAEFLDRWTGFFDRQGAAIYEGDILRAHYDWRY